MTLNELIQDAQDNPAEAEDRRQAHLERQSARTGRLSRFLGKDSKNRPIIRPVREVCDTDLTPVERRQVKQESEDYTDWRERQESDGTE